MPIPRHLALAALLGFATGLCYAQNKPACQLITNSALERVTGHKYGEPQDKPVEDTLLPFRFLPAIVAKSACYYPYASSDPWSTQGGLRVAVWYMQRTDPENAQQTFFSELARNGQGREVVPGGYPTIYTPLGSSSYVFKSVPSGLMILRIQAGIRYSSPQQALSEEFAAGLKLASGLLGEPNKLEGVVPSDQIIDPDESLRGQTGMSVAVRIDGIRDIPESTYRADIVVNLERLGITVFPRNVPPKFPVLVLDVDALSSSTSATNGRSVVRTPLVIYTLSLSFKQLFPIKAGGTKMVEGTTWLTGSFGVVPEEQAESIRDKVLKLIGVFGTSYQNVNKK